MMLESIWCIARWFPASRCVSSCRGQLITFSLRLAGGMLCSSFHHHQLSPACFILISFYALICSFLLRPLFSICGQRFCNQTINLAYVLIVLSSCVPPQNDFKGSGHPLHDDGDDGHHLRLTWLAAGIPFMMMMISSQFSLSRPRKIRAYFFTLPFIHPSNVLIDIPIGKREEEKLYHFAWELICEWKELIQFAPNV